MIRLILSISCSVSLVACDAVISDVAPDAPPPDGEPAPAFVPSNIELDDLEAGQAALVLDAPEVVVDTDEGRITDSQGVDLLPDGVVFRAGSQADGPRLGVFSATSLAIGADTEVVVRGDAALVFAIRGSAVIDGRILAVGGLDSTDDAGPGGSAGGNAQGGDGQGLGGGAGGPELADDLADTGGGGGAYAGPGGRGGDRADAPGGLGGATFGSARLIPLVGGSGGGFGGNPENGTPGLGGGGGGAVQISALETITIGAEGGINAGGGGGGGSPVDDGGGGGGSGGAILLEASAVVVSGVLAANGGGGGAGGNSGESGADGQSGGLDALPAAGGQGEGEGKSGGAGGAGGDAAGVDGDDSAGEPGDDNAGGGGGGGGRILIRGDTRELLGIVSPQQGTVDQPL